MGKPESKDSASKWYPKAQTAQELSNGMYNFIQGIKDSILRAADFNPQQNGDSAFKEDNLDISTRILVDDGYGKQLFQQLKDYRDKMLALDPEIDNEFQDNLPIDLTMPRVQNKENKTLEAAYFRMTPVVATLTMLSKFQNDVKSSENRVVEFCHKQVGQVEVVFDTYQPLVGSSATYLMDGQELKITAGLGAFNSDKKPTVSINGASAQVGPDGLARQKFKVSGVGSKTVNVTVNYTDQNGRLQTKTETIQYVVGSPTGASVSADAVKVLYIGLQNPVSISGGNVGDEKVHPVIDNGSLVKGDKPGKYIAEPQRPGIAKITLNIDGQTPQVFDFRVKSVPDPVAKVGNNKGGPMKVNEFKAQFGVRAELENFIFENVRFNVTGYTIVLQGAGFFPLQYRVVDGASFDAVRDLIEKAKPGGSRKLAPIQFNLQ